MPRNTQRFVAFTLMMTVALALGAILIGGLITTATDPKSIPNFSQTTPVMTIDHITRGPEALAMTAIYLDAKVAYEPEGYQDILESVGTSEKATNAEKATALQKAFKSDQSLFEYYQTVYRSFLRSLAKD